MIESRRKLKELEYTKELKHKDQNELIGGAVGGGVTKLITSDGKMDGMLHASHALHRRLNRIRNSRS